MPEKDALHRIANAIGFWGGLSALFMLFVLVASWVMLLFAVLPEWVQRKAQRLRADSRLPFWLGLSIITVLLFFGFALGAVGETVPVAGAIALLLFAFLLTLWALGWAPVALFVGQRIARAGGWDISPVTAALLGAFILPLGSLLPFAGWAVGIYWVIMAVGIAVTYP